MIRIIEIWILLEATETETFLQWSIQSAHVKTSNCKTLTWFVMMMRKKKKKKKTWSVIHIFQIWIQFRSMKRERSLPIDGRPIQSDKQTWDFPNLHRENMRDLRERCERERDIYNMPKKDYAVIFWKRKRKLERERERFLHCAWHSEKEKSRYGLEKEKKRNGKWNKIMVN